jgi:hypothetical protein
MEEFEKLVAESFQSDLLPAGNEEATTSGDLDLPATETHDSEPTQTADESELATAKHHESDPAA